MQKRYFGGFSSVDCIHSEFKIPPEKLLDTEVIIAVYERGTWDGNAMVAFQRNEKVFIVHGSHCSCYGLEGQFDVEEISLAALKHFFTDGTYLHYFERAECEEVLKYIGELV